MRDHRYVAPDGSVMTVAEMPTAAIHEVLRCDIELFDPEP